MASIVFLRAVNVGGHRAFEPSKLAAALADLEVVSLGAAGTFVVRAPANPQEVRRRFAAQLPFETTIMACAARDLATLVRSAPFARASMSDDWAVGILESRPRRLPELPHHAPGGDAWQVAVLSVHASFVACVQRRSGARRLYPNAVVEKLFGVAATTRNWATILKVAAALEVPAKAARPQAAKRPASRRRATQSPSTARRRSRR